MIHMIWNLIDIRLQEIYFSVKANFLKVDVQGLEMIDIAFDKLKDRDAETSAKLVERRQKFSKKSKEHQRQCLILCKGGDWILPVVNKQVPVKSVWK